jgi:TonB family protein
LESGILDWPYNAQIVSWLRFSNRWKIGGFGICLFLTATCSAGIDPALEQELSTASNLVEIRAVNAKSFRLELNFQAQFNVPQEGHLSLKWVAEDRWWMLITMADFRQMEIKNGETLYTTRSAPFTPLRISELHGLLTVLDDPNSWQIKKVRRANQDGMNADCLELRPHSHEGWSSDRQVCINPVTAEVLSDRTKDDREFRTKEFADYQSFGSHHYPRQLKLLESSGVVLKAQVVSLQEASFDDSVFAPPVGAIARRFCEHMVHPVAIKQPEPRYPKSASENRLGGTVVVALTVQIDGSVNNVQFLERAGHEMDEVTQEIVKTWKFRPAMCGNEPVAADIRVEMNFRMD